MKKLSKIIPLIFLVIAIASCNKLSNTKKITVSGTVIDGYSTSSLPNIQIQIDAIKPASNGLSSFGKRKTVGNFITDKYGKFGGTIQIFTDTEYLEYKVNFEEKDSFKDYSKIRWNQYLTAVIDNICPETTFKLIPNARLKIEVKNIEPHNQTDSFSAVIPGKIFARENYTGISPVKIDMWVGTDIWEAIYVEVEAEKLIRIYSKQISNGNIIFRQDSIFTKRDSLNSLLFEY